MNKRIITSDKAKCCGCGMCSINCPKKAITIKKDELGFEVPCIDTKICINCGACLKVCPIQSNHPLNTPISGYVVQSKIMSIRKNSTSGGAFTHLAENVVKEGGVVYGAVFDNKRVFHSRGDKLTDLERFRRSKYTQSSLVRSLESLNNDIMSGRKVLFSGTPCQVNAVMNKFGNYANLYTVEVMCREVAAPLLLSKYIEYIEGKYKKKVSLIHFRDKHYGYHYSVIKIIFNDKSEYYKPVNYDPYLKCFFSDAFARKCCYKCPFRKVERRADISIWDAWSISGYKGLKNDDQGATKVLVNSHKGKELLKLSESSMYLEEVPPKILWPKSDAEESIKYKNSYRYKRIDLSRLSGREFFKKYYPITPKVLARYYLKTFLYSFGIYQWIKKD